jgi:predicted ATP-grasp superfamily ATP-dependent carboligase
LLTAGEECLPISLNRQLVEPGKPFRYAGSQVPFSHREENAALDLACQAVSSIPGLNGYVGVDLVIAEDKPYLIEINPRITTSYIGLRQVAQTNLAKAIWEACRDGALPDSIPLAGQVVIRKNDPFSWGLRGIL